MLFGVIIEAEAWAETERADKMEVVIAFDIEAEIGNGSSFVAG